MADITKSDAQAIIDAAPRPMMLGENDQATGFAGGQALIPNGWKREDLEFLLSKPRRARGSRKAHDAASFIALVKQYATPETQTFCNARFDTGDALFVTTFNPHVSATAPGWDDFRAIYNVPKSEEWKRWTTAHKHEFSQGEFALWIEDNVRDIAEGDGYPSGSQMLEMALAFETTQDSRLRSSVRLQSGGIEMTYIDREDDATLKKMRMFERFALGIAPFRSGQHYRVTARLRYSAKDGRVTFWYELIRPDLIVEDAVNDLAKSIAEATARPVLFGEIG